MRVTDIAENYYRQLAAGAHAVGPKGTVVFVVFTDQLEERRGDLFVALGLGKQLQKLGWGVRLWPSRQWEQPLEGPADVAIVMIEAFVPDLLPPRVATIAWARNWTEKWVRVPYLAHFDAIWASSSPSADALAEASGREVQVVPIGVDPELFSPGTGVKDIEVFSSANLWGEERDIAAALERVARSHDVVWVGERPSADGPAGIEFPGPVSYFDVPGWYRRSTVVVDDQIPPAKRYGNQNSRIFESISAGAVPITNSALGLDELGLGGVPVYENPDHLVQLIDGLLNEPDATARLQQELREVVGRLHGFEHRAALVEPWINDLARSTASRTSPAPLLSWIAGERARFRALSDAHAISQQRIAELTAEPSTASVLAAAAGRLARLPARVARRLLSRGGR